MSALLSLTCQEGFLLTVKNLICRVGLLFLFLLLIVAICLLIRIAIIILISTRSICEWKVSFDLEAPKCRAQLGAILLKHVLEGV